MYFSKRDVLVDVALLGFFFLLTGLFYLPSHSAYKTTIYVFLFIPGVIGFFKSKGLKEYFFNDKLLRVLLCLIALGACSSFWGASEEPLKQFKRALFPLFFLFSVIYIAEKNLSDLYRILSLSAVVASFFSVYILWKFYFIEDHPFRSRLIGIGNTYHSILLTFIYGFYAVFSLTRLFEERRVFIKVGWWLVAVTLFVCVFMTKSRGPMLGLFVAFLVVFFCSERKSVWPYLVCLITLLVPYFYVFGDKLLSRGGSFRLELWELGLDAYLENIIWGAGIGSEFNFKLFKGVVHDHPHNMYIQILVELGTIGGLLFMVSVLHVFFSELRQRTTTFFLSMLCFSGIVMMFDGDSLFSRPREVWFLFWIPMGVYIAYKLASENPDKKDSR